MKQPKTDTAATVEEFKLEESVPYQLAVTASAVNKLFSRNFVDQFDLSIAEWRVLTVVGRNGGISPTAVAEAAGMDKVKVSRATAALVARGLLRQEQDSRDGRARVLSLTRKGVKLHNSAVPMTRRLEASIAQCMSKAEWSSLQRSLMRLAAHVVLLAGGADIAGGLDG